MNKKLLAAAVAAAMIAPAAYADATLYGKFHVSVDANDIDVANTTVGDIDNYTVNSRASRIGASASGRRSRSRAANACGRWGSSRPSRSWR